MTLGQNEHQVYFAVTVIHHGKNGTKIAYTKHIFDDEIKAIEKCKWFQSIKGIKKSILNWGIEPITEEDKIKVESGEVVYL